MSFLIYACGILVMMLLHSRLQRPAGCETVPSLATIYRGPGSCGFSSRDEEEAVDPLSLADDDFTNFAFSIAWYNPSHLLVRPLLRMRKLREFARVATPSQLLQ